MKKLFSNNKQKSNEILIDSTILLIKFEILNDFIVEIHV